MLSSSQLEALTSLRHELHTYPEVSGQEVETRKRVREFLQAIAPSAKVINAGKGLLTIFESKQSGPVTMMRCELDALPITELNEMAYKSRNQGVSHKCGHDGHMCMVIGLAYLLEAKPPKKGKVVLLFQSAEEIGQGAQWMLDEHVFQQHQPDYAFALHNLPGLPLHQITCKPGTFCAASTGVKIHLTGKTAHASSPHTGISPVNAIGQLSMKLNNLVSENSFSDFVLLTITHIQVGEPTFGVSPGKAELRLTIRAYQDEDLNLLKSLIQSISENIAIAESLSLNLTYDEPFAATMNDEDAVSMIKESATVAGLSFTDMPVPNPWSEDFGLFLHNAKGAMFGLGAGVNQPALHNPDYDFPDELIETGVEVFLGLIRGLNY